MKGAYVLIINVKQSVSFRIKSLGDISFEPGQWVYVGSAMGETSTNLENRIRRHFRREKTIYWHIDYLLNANVETREVVFVESELHVECDIAQSLAEHADFKPGPKGFGSSDCKRGCTSHTYLYQGRQPIHTVLIHILQRLGFQPLITKDGQI